MLIQEFPTVYYTKTPSTQPDTEPSDGAMTHLKNEDDF